MTTTQRYRGRFAPSPTGALHLGSLLAAVASWLRARQNRGDWLLRVEDIDPHREVAGASPAIIQTLAAFGMVPDEPIVYQHDRNDRYQEALQTLIDHDHAFPCRCSRNDIAGTAGHRGRCRPVPGDTRTPAWRMLAPDIDIGFDDIVQGRYTQNLRHQVGDFVLRRRDGLWAYQLAVVVDDADQGITEVVRGADLLDSTPRQILLQRALALPTPAYLHVPVLLDDSGNKLSKRLDSVPVDAGDPLPALCLILRLLGVPTNELPAGQDPERLLQAAVARFDPGRISRTRALRSATWNLQHNG